MVYITPQYTEWLYIVLCHALVILFNLTQDYEVIIAKLSILEIKLTGSGNDPMCVLRSNRDTIEMTLATPLRHWFQSPDSYLFF